MNLAEFETLSARVPDGSGYELNGGKLVAMSPAARPHSRRVYRIYRMQIKLLAEEKFDILPDEVGFVLAVEPTATVRAADLAVMETKRVQYLEAGVQEVWIVYDQPRTIHVFRNDDFLVCDQQSSFESNLGFTVEGASVFR